MHGFKEKGGGVTMQKYALEAQRYAALVPPQCVNCLANAIDRALLEEKDIQYLQDIAACCPLEHQSCIRRESGEETTSKGQGCVA